MSTMKSLRVLLRRTMAIAVLAIPMEATSGEDRRIALAFDDGPSSSSNEALLNELERLEIKATFFPETLTLKNEKNNAQKRGKGKTPKSREIASAKAQREIDGAKRILRNLGERNPNLLAPSFARLPEAYEQDSANYWNFPGDTLADLDDPQEIADLLVENAFPGAVVILHPLYNQREQILRALPLINERLKAEGYEFATLSELPYKLT
ncbi:polysaccharide deacetylase family protein [Microbulbifer pacificus]|uniref:polysaccharide deacetylase family protein n=1 Tax=Microbulbifer pacificus TaxID=407164 RepID=UPI000CF56CDF|nr:polysaccharide deacetylase family protein [Microbulbifer pacificus]